MNLRRTASLAIGLLAAGLFIMPSFAEDAAPPQPKQKPGAASTATGTTQPKATAAKKTAKPDASATVQAGLLPRATPKGGTVIMMRGLANIWSRGMDTMAKKFEAQNLDVTLINHGVWRKVADKLMADYKADKATAPIILIGHSLGGDASLVMANFLGMNNVPVRLIVVFDAVAQTHPIIGTVDEVLNFYKPSGYGQDVKPGRGFKGTLTNVDMTKRADIGHLNIDKDVNLQAEVLDKVLVILGMKPLTDPKAKPKGEAQQEKPVAKPTAKPVSG